jgi:hypothetical protein
MTWPIQSRRLDTPGSLRWDVWPILLYIAAALVLLGTSAFLSAFNMLHEQPNRDIWQHAAALRALIENLEAPQNPFVPGGETSRHFHPLWVGVAMMARVFDLSVWQALSLSGFIVATVLAIGIYAFARRYFQMRWAPVVLLVTMLLGWSAHVEHTGMHSLKTLLFGSAYPATLLVGLSLILWAATIQSFVKPPYLAGIALLSALMFSTHQLGAVLGFIGAGSFALLWPEGGLRQRAAIIIALFLGIGAALFWPYYNPLLMMLQPGSSRWNGGQDFYSLGFLTWPFVPAVLGVLGLRDAKSRPLVLALVLYTLVYLVGFSGLLIAGRFLSGSLLVLHIGLAAIILKLFQDRAANGLPLRNTVILGGITAVFLFGFAVCEFQVRHLNNRAIAPDIYGNALALTVDIPDTKPVAAYSSTAWPIVATGQRVLSVPWPEPGITDLARRQDQTNDLFDSTLSSDDRRTLARQVGVTVLIVDRRFLSEARLAQLASDAIIVTDEGMMRRFDLRP